VCTCDDQDADGEAIWYANFPNCGVATFHVLLRDGHGQVFGFFREIEPLLVGLPLPVNVLGWIRYDQQAQDFDPLCLI